MNKKIFLIIYLMTMNVFANSPPIDSYFLNTFAESDRAFDAAFEKIKAIDPDVKKHVFKYSQGEIKSLYWPKSKNNKNLLIIISGTHGAEAFVGSAVQRWMLDQDFVQSTNQNDYLFIHGLNIYGFKNNRRVNELNIDLNRNFVIQRSDFNSDDSGYEKLNHFLNPEVAAEFGLFSNIRFILGALRQIISHGLDNLRNPILRGQYSFPQGLFYGGSENAVQTKLFQELKDQYIRGYQKIFIIDLHTGYGEKGKLHLLADASAKNKNFLNIFGGEANVDLSSKKSFYAAQGEVLTYFIHMLENSKPEHNKQAPEVLGITYEYGTLDSQTTWGSIDSLRRMVRENQNFWFPAKQVVDSKEIQKEFSEMFNPQDSLWRKKIIQQTGEKTLQIQKWFSATN